MALVACLSMQQTYNLLHHLADRKGINTKVMQWEIRSNPSHCDHTAAQSRLIALVIIYSVLPSFPPVMAPQWRLRFLLLCPAALPWQSQLCLCGILNLLLKHYSLLSRKECLPTRPSTLAQTIVCVGTAHKGSLSHVCSITPFQSTIRKNTVTELGVAGGCPREVSICTALPN